MDKNTRATAVLSCVILVLLFIGMRLTTAATSIPGKYDAFAQCLQDKGAAFYGAFWCPHCQEQKSWFGSSEKHLPYVECSRFIFGQNAVCSQKDIQAYPTWIFADGSRLVGEVPLDTLSEKTGCELPE